MRRRIIFGIATALLIIFALFQAKPKDQAESAKPIRVGAIVTLTGASGAFGEYARDGYELAKEKINTSGGISGRPIELVYEDDACDPTNGVSIAKKFIDLNQIKIILGPVCSSVSLAIAPVAEENQAIMFTSISSAAQLKNAGDYIFRNRVSGEEHSKLMAEYVYNGLSADTAASLYINLDNGIDYKNAFAKYFKEYGGKIVIEEPYTKDNPDFRTQLSKIKQARPEAIFIAGQGSENAFKQAREMGIEATLVGPTTVESAELISIAGKAAEGIVYSASAFNPTATQGHVQQFVETYRSKHGKLPTAFVADAYDALMLISDALKQCNESDTACIRDYLYGVKEYPGVGGLTTFDEFGEVIKPLMKKTVKDGQFVPY